MTVVIPQGVKDELVRRTAPMRDRGDEVDLGRAAAEKALATSTATLVDLLAQHLGPGEELRDVMASSRWKQGLRGCTVRVSLLVFTDQRILQALEDQTEGVAPTVHAFTYGSLPVRGKRMHAGGPTVVHEPGGVVIETRKGKVEEITARLSAPPQRADWLTTASSVEAAPDDGPPPPAWHPDPVGRHEYRWWDGTEWTAQVADDGVTSSDPLPTG